MNCAIGVLGFLLIGVILTKSLSAGALFPLTIVHVNDFHSRYDPIDKHGNTCDEGHEKCIGGLARLIYTIRDIKKKRQKENVLYLNAGDNYQGTLHFKIGGAKITYEMMNLEPPDFMTLGNHEFDNGIPGLMPFLNNIHSSVVLTNVNATNDRLVSSAIKTFKGSTRKIGIIGLLAHNIKCIGYGQWPNPISNTFRSFVHYKNIFEHSASLCKSRSPLLSSVIAEFHSLCSSELFISPTGDDADAAATYIMKLTNVFYWQTLVKQGNLGDWKFKKECKAALNEAKKLKAQGVNIIIAITHIGYTEEKILAYKTAGFIDVIVGGHSHSFLYNSTIRAPTSEVIEGPYPTIIERRRDTVLVLQAGSYSKYVGLIAVHFDDDGKIQKWEGSPIYMDTEVPQANDVLVALKSWSGPVNVANNRQLGSSLNVVRGQYECRSGECALGNFYTDALIYGAGGDKENCKHSKVWTTVPIAIINCGTMRTTMPQGKWSYGQILSMSPFDNIIYTATLKGKLIREALEDMVTEFGGDVLMSRKMMQVSGIKVVYHVWQPPNHRILSVKVRKAACPFGSYEDLQDNREYTIVTNDFLLDTHPVLKKAKNRRVVKLVHDILEEYLKVFSPVSPQLENRIELLYEQ